ncbi:hypothetical protein BU26DRAFT_563944 [Trematosphaeria pertusa]|uniref:RING-type domain-containing protein n=1 Tax=Trematosphaeria pertusa TaxID=390896 RepID=A0A6A6IKQ1_9PLEO|nr:uncharacterized protein BU26DRAFT_563944 [Trematosphaeria pertusa]KAF2250063.1 hypothetical protein BU26DRAFT_563944 [Trematosphaeria pertusa]
MEPIEEMNDQEAVTTPQTDCRGASPRFRRIRLPELEKLFGKPHIRKNPPEAGRILACFTNLSLCIASGAYISAEAALEGVCTYWYELVETVDLNDDNRSHLRRVDLAHTVRRLWEEIREERWRGLCGQDLLLRAGAQVNMVGLLLFGVESVDDPRKEQLLQQPSQLFPISFPRRRERVEPIDLGAISSPLDSRTPESAEAECAICRDRVEDGVKIKCCRHCFCRECLDAWLNGEGEGATDNCPMCKAKLTA